MDDPPVRPSAFTKFSSSVIPSYDVYSTADKLAEAKLVRRLGDECHPFFVCFVLLNRIEKVEIERIVNGFPARQEEYQPIIGVFRF
ncbi:hypothetical protein CEXT_740821 [Caerostris extrusa]|uniref:Uncharacterized protein n=1 Tax=Caerostris extrusa TaxID=172846 RepID=A0AAV4PX21_CAEEX|nr:hypothetical protein CEXT_740821 [Caerostris extrusa]